MSLIPGIGPKAGLEICRATLRKELNQDIENFDLIYLRDTKEIKFEVHNFLNEKGVRGKARINYSSDKLINIIDAFLMKEMKTKDVIKGAKVNYINATCDVFLESETGERTVKTIKL